MVTASWLSSSWDLRLSADKLADHEQQAAGNRVQGGSDVVIPTSTTPETLRMGKHVAVKPQKGCTQVVNAGNMLGLTIEVLLLRSLT